MGRTPPSSESSPTATTASVRRDGSCLVAVRMPECDRQIEAGAVLLAAGRVRGSRRFGRWAVRIRTSATPSALAPAPPGPRRPARPTTANDGNPGPTSTSTSTGVGSDPEYRRRPDSGTESRSLHVAGKKRRTMVAKQRPIFTDHQQRDDVEPDDGLRDSGMLHVRGGQPGIALLLCWRYGVLRRSLPSAATRLDLAQVRGSRPRAPQCRFFRPGSASCARPRSFPIVRDTLPPRPLPCCRVSCVGLSSAPPPARSVTGSK